MPVSENRVANNGAASHVIFVIFLVPVIITLLFWLSFVPAKDPQEPTALAVLLLLIGNRSCLVLVD